MTDIATSSSSTEKQLAKVLGGYQSRSKALRQKMVEVAETLDRSRIDLETKRLALVGEEAAIGSRLEGLREDVEVVMRRERHAQDVYRDRRDELASLGQVNGH